FTPYFSGTWMRRQRTVGDFSTYQTDVPRLSGRLGLRSEDTIANANMWLDLFVQRATALDQRERGSEQSAQGSGDLAGWGTLLVSVGSSFGPQDRYRAALHLNNLLDKDYRAGVDELPGLGRNLVLTFTSKF